MFIKSRLSVVFSVLMLGMVSAEAVVYVDASRAGGNGNAWSSAYRTLESAIAGRGTGQEFWVAKGTYTPATTLRPTSGSSIYGGFSGTETDRSQRNVSVNPTILDGQNSLSQVMLIPNTSPNVILDGLVIRRGAAAGAISNGGGLYVHQIVATIQNCRFENNSAAGWGGGVFLDRSNSSVLNCVFQGNIGTTGGGGLGGYESSPTLSQTSFIANQATGSGDRTGGGIWFVYGQPTISSCTFSNNVAREGGGVRFNECPSVTVSGSVFTGNRYLITGGGISSSHATLTANVSLVVSNCQFIGNVGCQQLPIHWECQ